MSETKPSTEASIESTPPSRFRRGLQDLSQWWDRNKEWILTSTYFVVGIISTFILINSHEGCIVHTGWKHIGLFHVEFYRVPRILSGKDWYLTGDEMWDFYAILQTMFFSILIIAEPDEKKGVKWIFGLGILIFIVCLVGIGFLGSHDLYADDLRGIKYYQYSLLFILLFLAFADRVMFWWTDYKHVEYRLLFYFVDIPMILTILFIFAHVHIPIDQRHTHFFSGAIAFQLILGNMVVFLVRSYKRITQDTRRGMLKTLILVLFGDLWEAVKR